MPHKTVADRLAASEYFKLVKVVSTSDEAKQLIRDQKADLAMVFPEHFGRTKQQIQFIVDGADPNMAQLWTNYARIVITNPKGSVVNTKLLYNPQMRSAYNFVPATIGILLMLICAMMTSISIVREREKGTMEVLLVSPIQPIMIIVAKVIPYLVLAFIILIIILLMAAFVLDVPMQGSLFGIFSYLHHLHSSGSCIWFCWFLTLQKHNFEALLLSAMVLLMPILLLSGMIFPIESMPRILQYVSAIIPTRYYTCAMRKLMIMGVSIKEVYHEIAILVGMLVVLLSLSLAKFNKRLD